MAVVSLSKAGDRQGAENRRRDEIREVDTALVRAYACFSSPLVGSRFPIFARFKMFYKGEYTVLSSEQTVLLCRSIIQEKLHRSVYDG